jgi:mRNA export factor
VQNIESPLKMQTRCIANFTDKSGFAVGSIEGRVAIQQVEEKTKCVGVRSACGVSA